MNISVFGLGYVGCVSAVCLARMGHNIIGADVNIEKVKMLNSGMSPVVEPGLEEEIKLRIKNGNLCATLDASFAVSNSELSFVCVGTPSNSNGSINLTYVKRVCEEIGAALSKKPKYHVVAIRSTVLPGVIEDKLIPVIEQTSNKKNTKGFSLCMNPEFLREGTAIEDFFNPPKIVIGTMDKRSGDILESSYKNIDSPVFKCDIRTAEMIKYVDNCFHALKISFANEIGRMCKTIGIDSRKVMDIFCADTKLNISKAYLKPGFAFGGSCLPKDLRALNYKLKTNDIEVPVLSSILASNEEHIKFAFDKIASFGKKKIGLIGLSFKSNTDDLRESPLVEIVERLIGKGYDVKVYDPNVSLAKVVGANKEYINNHIPHISRVLVDDIREILDNSKVIVIVNKFDSIEKCLVEAIDKTEVIFIDYTRLDESRTFDRGNYHGMY